MPGGLFSVLPIRPVAQDRMKGTDSACCPVAVPVIACQHSQTDRQRGWGASQLRITEGTSS